MRTTVVIPDSIIDEVKNEIGGGSLSEFVRKSVVYHLAALKRESMVREMEAGYEVEAENPSLDAAWDDVETEDWS